MCATAALNSLEASLVMCVLPTAPWEVIHKPVSGVAASFILPSDLTTYRAGRVNQASLSRLAKTSRLNKYMQVLKGNFPLHFGMSTKLVLNANNTNCPYTNSVPMHEYYVFKKILTFAPFTYASNAVCPSPKTTAVSNQRATLGFIFKAFYMWCKERFRTLLVQDVSGGATLSTLEHAEERKYKNCLEVFLWFCAEIEKSRLLLNSQVDNVVLAVFTHLCAWS
ncbi:hypothetical protein BDR06DRAFT_978159 [Suillus hirtellus]|nr:hypothetical protein BDR06DRAFT_978159 [Suillus hirtellus]